MCSYRFVSIALSYYSGEPIIDLLIGRESFENVIQLGDLFLSNDRARLHFMNKLSSPRLISSSTEPIFGKGVSRGD